MRVLFISLFAGMLVFSLAGFALANGGDTHGDAMMTQEEHNAIMTQTTDRSDQLPAALVGFVIGVLVGVVAVKFFFTRTP